MPKSSNPTVSLKEAVKSWPDKRDPDDLADKLDSKSLFHLYPGERLNKPIEKLPPYLAWKQNKKKHH